MAQKEFYHDIDGQKAFNLKNWLLNPLTSAEKTTLAGTLGVANTGLVVTDTTLKKIFLWDGTAFVSWGDAVTGAVVNRGTHSDLVNAPSNVDNGSQYIITTAGTLTWAGITFTPDAVVQVGDTALFTSPTDVSIIQGNAVQATESASGIAELATQSETNTGTDDATVVTPLKLTQFTINKAFAKTYFASGVGLTANTAFTVTHNLQLQNKNAFVISVKDSAGSEVSVDVDSVSVNSLTVTSGVTVTNFTITVIGF